jgi:hypothetical protein
LLSLANEQHNTTVIDVYSPLNQTTNLMSKDRSKPYARCQTFDLILPYQFVLLCRMLQVTPEQVLYNFMCNLGQEGYSQGDEQKLMAMEYLIACKHGQPLYTETDIRTMVAGLDEISGLFPWKGKTHLKDIRTQYRSRYQQYWYRKWYPKRLQQQQF